MGAGGHSHQRGHVSSVHLATGNLLLGRGHAAHLEILWTRGSGAHDGGQGHRAVLHLPHPVVLLLKDCRPREGTHGEALWPSSRPSHQLFRLRRPWGLGGRGPEVSLQPPTPWRTTLRAPRPPTRLASPPLNREISPVPFILFGGHRVLEHSRLLISFQPKVVFAFFL